MSTRNLENLFRPSSVAVIGASIREGRIGHLVINNLLDSAYRGVLLPVNPKYHHIADLPCYRAIGDLEAAPELAVICTPAATIPPIIAELGRRGTKAAIVCTECVGQPGGSDEQHLRKAMLVAARPHLLRILGPDSLGLIVPGEGLNASYAPTVALPGKIAFVSQSRAVTAAVLDWAHASQVGFSHVVSLGASGDVDIGDAIDYLGSDPTAKAILLYIESIGPGRKFLSAARAAARNKPVVVVKSARSPEGVAAARARGDVAVVQDTAFEAAIRRAGMLRMDNITALVSAAEMLARSRPLAGNRVTIISNGTGPAVVAADALAMGGARLASLSPETRGRLSELLAAERVTCNPIVIPGDVSAQTYGKVLEVALAAAGSDAVFLIYAPDARLSAEAIARSCAPVARSADRNVLACWLGGDAARAPLKVFAEAGIPCYESPEAAAQAFLSMATYQRNKEALLQTPTSQPTEFSPDSAKARAILQVALASKRTSLSEPHALALLAAYDIPVVPTRMARTAKEAVALAEELGYPVALKVVVPGLTRKSDIGGVVLHVDNAAEVRQAIRHMRRRLRQKMAGARPSGFVVQRMVDTQGVTEVFVGVTVDPVFGPVILFGEGGMAAEVTGEQAVALPPLNIALARELVSRTKIAKLLEGYRDRPAANLHALYLTLTKLAQLTIDQPQIVGLEINPLLVDDKGVLLLDAHVRIASTAIKGPERLAILPYPKELEEDAEFDGRHILLRPIRPEDEAQFQAFLAKMDPQDLRFRFFRTVREFTHSEVARITQIDYSREMTFVAVSDVDGGVAEILGEARAVFDPDDVGAEFGVTVRSDLTGKGLGTTLLAKLLRYCHERRITEVRGEVLAANERMLQLAGTLGFSVEWPAGGGSATIHLPLERLETALKTLSHPPAATPMAVNAGRSVRRRESRGS